MTYLSEQDASGGKLQGLSDLPIPWVPPFFAIPGELHRRWLESSCGPVPRPSDLLDPSEISWIEAQVQRFGAQPQSVSLLVRSNAGEEGVEQRGLLKSVRCDGTVEAIFSAAVEIFGATPNLGPSPPVGLLVQAYCPPILAGHLSNERRLSEEMRGWVCEIDPQLRLGSEQGSRIARWRVEECPVAAYGELLCSDRKGLVPVLKSVAKYFYERRERRHLEWVWDGTNVWVVQADRAPDPKGESPEPVYLPASPPVKVPRLRHFRPFSSGDARRWQKLRCVEAFRSMGLPTTSLYVLSGSRKVQQLASGSAPEGLSADLKELTKAPLVIRTDIAGQTTLFASRTDCMSSPEPAVRFLRDTASRLLEAGVRPGQICFIAHRFIPAQASALSIATPRGHRARVDALWGLPDGLEFCSHDSFEVDVRSGSMVARRIRYKPTFLAALPDNSWRSAPLGAPWDWKPSIDDRTAREISELSGRLATRLGKAVVIMWFVGVSPNSGHPGLIPWRYTTEGGPAGGLEPVFGEHFFSRPFPVRNPTDLGGLGEASGPISSVVLRPDGPHLRDKSFLEQLGATAVARGLRIDLEGSPLSHTYYVLKRAGAHVACIDPIKGRGLRQRFAKLVRDRIPVRIQMAGEKVLAVSLPKGELLDVLKAKVVEEAMEVLLAPSPDALREEMADVLEVLIALCRLGGISLGRLQRVAALKRKKAGGFAKGMMLVQTEEIPLLEVRSAGGLFDLGDAKQAKDSYNAIVAAGRRPKTRRDRIVVPLIPPVPDRLRGPTRVYFRSPNLEFEVWYREKSAEIILVQRRADTSKQLELPFERPARK